MRLIRLLPILALALGLGLTGPAGAQEFDLPGLGRDTSAYQQPPPGRNASASASPTPTTGSDWRRRS